MVYFIIFVSIWCSILALRSIEFEFILKRYTMVGLNLRFMTKDGVLTASFCWGEGGGGIETY